MVFDELYNKKIILTAILALALVFGMTVVGRGDGGDDGVVFLVLL